MQKGTFWEVDPDIQLIADDGPDQRPLKEDPVDYFDGSNPSAQLVAKTCGRISKYRLVHC